MKNKLWCLTFENVNGKIETVKNTKLTVYATVNTKTGEVETSNIKCEKQDSDNLVDDWEWREFRIVEPVQNQGNQALKDALKLVDFGACRDGDPVDWVNVASPMCAHCIGLEDVNLAAARIITEEYRKITQL